MISDRSPTASVPPIHSLILQFSTFVRLAEKTLYELLLLFAQNAAFLLFQGKERTIPALSASLKKDISGWQGPLGYIREHLWRQFITLSTKRRRPFAGH